MKEKTMDSLDKVLEAISKGDSPKALKNLILAEYIPKSKVLEAIGEDEPEKEIEESGFGQSSIVTLPTAMSRNKLRAEIKSKLNLEDK